VRRSSAEVPRRVIHVASGREWRGGQNQVFLLARELSRRPEPVPQIIITGAGSLLAERLAQSRVRTRLVGWNVGLSPAVLAAAIGEARREPALFHAHDAHSLTLAGLAGQLTGTPFIVTRRVIYPLRRAGLWTRAERVIAVSGAVRDQLVRDGIARERIAVVHSGIDLDVVRGVSPGLIRKELGLPERGALVVSTGALDRDKAPDLLLDAARGLAERFPPLHWALAGEGPLDSALRTRLDQSNLRDRVSLVGRLEPHDSLRLIAAADVFATATRAEGLGTSILEAMALGTPVVATSAGGVPELLANGAGILVGPDDTAALAAGVARLLTDERARLACVTAATARVEGFTARAMADGVRAVYRSLGL
jgi:glycosyltransferase involved in cell wall biosynthesis